MKFELKTITKLTVYADRGVRMILNTIFLRTDRAIKPNSMMSGSFNKSAGFRRLILNNYRGSY